MNKKDVFLYLKNRLLYLKQKLNKNSSHNSKLINEEPQILTADNCETKSQFCKIYLPYSSNYSKKNLINRFYDSLFINALSNNIELSINKGEWDIVLSHLYNIFYNNSFIQYFESCYCNSIFSNLEEKKCLTINDFLDQFIIPLDIQICESPIDICLLEDCYNKIRNDLGKYMIDHIEQYIYK